MKISLIKYGRSFLLPDGNWEKIGIEIELSDTDNPDNARQLAKEFVDEAFKKNNPGYQAIQNLNLGELPVIQVEKETAEDRRIAAHVKDIENCKTLKTLELFRGMLGDSILIKKAFERKQEQLTLNNKP